MPPTFRISCTPTTRWSTSKSEEKRGQSPFLSASGPGGGAHPTPDGSPPKPGGSNRIQIRVADLAEEVASLREAGAHFGTDIVTGIGARQILLRDPSGNLIELHELLPGAQQRG